ncbi:MAG: response regulator transcription factor [Eubacteriales bacterium]|nr:response regulator transcription factor [Eubacteriales bacterium]
MARDYHVLIIEDDEDIAMVEQVYLENSGYRVSILKNGDHIQEILQENTYDLILLDLMLPGKNGYQICQEIRDIYPMPIIMVTAKSESFDKIRGLNQGADDYISKPFDPAELVARVGANIRQYERQLSARPVEQKEIRVGNLRIFPESHKVYKSGEELRFPNREFELLLFLAENSNLVFSKEQLFEKIWGYDYVGDSATVMVHVNRIREKIEDDSKDPKIIETIRGVGYRLNM